MLTGIEVAGLVLGSFPILLNCLDYYREGFEPLEEWWNFRTHFIAFVDDVRHQMMRYNENMIRLLDPIVTDNESLTKLVGNPRDPRWRDGSLDEPLEQRLASEHERFLRIVDRMNEVVEDLKRLLQIQDGRVSWTGSSEHKPWEWHLKRVQISFSKGKYRKVRKLATYNQELQEILGYSERVIPIADKRKFSEPVTLFEKIRQHACCVHNALKRHWKCDGQKCRTHQAHLSLRGETKTVSLNVLFILESEQGSHSKPRKQEVVIQPGREKATSSPVISAPQISYVQQAASFTAVQETVEALGVKSKLSIGKLLPKVLRKTLLESPADGNTNTLPKREKRVNFAPPIPTIAISQHTQAFCSPDITPGCSISPPQLIPDLCSFLRGSQDLRIGIILDESERQFELSKSSKGPGMIASDTARLVPLPELLDAHYQARIDISRQSRFAMATNIASAFLQAHMSPWLSPTWSKRDFYFLADSHTLYSSYPYVSRTYASRRPDSRELTTDDAASAYSQQSPEEHTRACLFTVGVMILELIFGQNIESCNFRKDYYGAGNRPNDQTDISTAQRWAKKVLGECGADIADVVRRCLDCSFGPRPIFSDGRFREAVYEGVIKPLADYSKIWPDVVP